MAAIFTARQVDIGGFTPSIRVRQIKPTSSVQRGFFAVAGLPHHEFLRLKVQPVFGKSATNRL
ncbi:hypothetical protein FNJ84_00970 [Paracoccus sp. M683]|uniref:hypothetical protein n=1 Tax=Paracoccus sp. M683 TaxID=2594268 RepID=UPI00117E92D0|nr:hypothetical protein [Paracoccus sp. M683]TRW99280.1 hypothetical protein FNJ84_00970 [Paracoccus sp. M683]